jgi:hypothetical protein
MYQIAQSYPELPPCIFIRYNPDNYTNNKGNIIKNGTTYRQELLVKWVKFCIKWENVTGLKVKYLFYDGFDESDISFEDVNKEDLI